jgi:hypothetical protein
LSKEFLVQQLPRRVQRVRSRHYAANFRFT